MATCSRLLLYRCPFDLDPTCQYANLSICAPHVRSDILQVRKCMFGFLFANLIAQGLVVNRMSWDCLFGVVRVAAAILLHRQIEVCGAVPVVLAIARCTILASSGKHISFILPWWCKERTESKLCSHSGLYPKIVL